MLLPLSLVDEIMTYYLMYCIIQAFAYELPIIEASLFELLLVTIWFVGGFYLYGKFIDREDRRKYK